jgi:putative sigma-54 modulation protein
MNMHIQTRGFIATDAIRDYAVRRLQFVLSSHADVVNVDMTLADVNGPKGGRDKCCKIRLSVSGEAPIHIEDMNDDMYAAIDSATERCKRTLVRRVTRARDRRQVVLSIKRLGARS